MEAGRPNQTQIRKQNEERNVRLAKKTADCRRGDGDARTYLREAPAYLGLTLHCHFGGRPLVCAVFDKILKYFAQFPGVWFASHGEIARWVLDHNIEAETHAKRLLAGAAS